MIRTLDIGADKQVDYFDMKEEENPALGVRAIRICLNRPEVFRTQRYSAPSCALCIGHLFTAKLPLCSP